MSTATRKRSLSGPSGSVKKKKYNCKFQADWMKDFYDQVHSAMNLHFAHYVQSTFWMLELLGGKCVI